MRGATCGTIAASLQFRLFQSTLLMRGATISLGISFLNLPISIHAPHARSDISPNISRTLTKKFQSTLLMRGATPSFYRCCTCRHISIHAPHARSDATRCVHLNQSEYFNPRSSCEERQGNRTVRNSTSNFNPRSSCEERRHNNPHSSGYVKFQSTLLMRGATIIGSILRSYLIQISIHAPHARSDKWRASKYLMLTISIHAPHARSDI